MNQGDLLVVTENDSGMYDALNKGLARCRGDVLSWLNADEQYLPGSLAYVAEAFRRRPDVDVIFGDALIVSPTGELIAARREVPMRRAYLANSFLYSLSCTTFFRRRLFDAGDLVFNPSRRAAGDAELMLSLLEKGRKVHHVRRYLGLFTMDGRNLSLDPVAQEECQEIFGLEHKHAAVLAARCARHVEKLVRGCYRRSAVEYEWAVDDRPSHRRYSYDRAPTRFEWQLVDRDGTA
jgi:glycosyltransferase involved in cell wall biosynthesis